MVSSGDLAGNRTLALSLKGSYPSAN